MSEENSFDYPLSESGKVVLSPDVIQRVLKDHPSNNVLGLDHRFFITPELMAAVSKSRFYGPSGWLAFVGCNSGLERVVRVHERTERNLIEAGSSIHQVPFIKGEFNGGYITRWFKDGELVTRLDSHIGGGDVFVFSDVHNLNSERSTIENNEELRLTVWTLKSQGAKRVTVVTPYLPFSRGHHRSDMKREAVTGAYNAAMLAATGADAIVFVDPHNDDLVGVYEALKMRVTALNGYHIPMNIMAAIKGDPRYLGVAPDDGAAKRMSRICDEVEGLDIDFTIINKLRGQTLDDDVSSEGASLYSQVLVGKEVGIHIDDEAVSYNSVRLAIRDVDEQMAKMRLPLLRENWVYTTHNKTHEEYLPEIRKMIIDGRVTRLMFGDTVGQTKDVLRLAQAECYSTDAVLTDTINRLHTEFSVGACFYPNVPAGRVMMERVN